MLYLPCMQKEFPNRGAQILAWWARAVSQANVARILGVPHNYIHYWIGGREPSIDAAHAMQRRLWIPIESWVSPPRDDVDEGLLPRPTGEE